MRKYRIERKIKVVSSSLDDFGRIKTGLSGLLAGLLICLVVGSFCVVTYGASGADASATEDVVHEADASATEDVVHGADASATEDVVHGADASATESPVERMFDWCKRVLCRYQTYPRESHLKEKETYQNYDNTKLAWWFRRDMNHGPSGCDDTIDIAEYDGYYLDSDASSQNEKVLYLTFDCGYENGYTGQMLDILKKEDVPACFFVTQTYIRDNVDLVKRMKEEGHQVGNHTIYHICMPDKSYEEIVQEVNGCADYMKEATGYAMDPYLRPPCGEYSARTLAITQDLGFKTIFWSMAYMDFDVNNQPGVDFAIDHFNKYHHSGAIILMHNVSSSNAGALEKVIANLKAEGYRFASLNELQ